MSFPAAIDRPLPLKQRRDLVVREQWFAGRRHFVLHDPLALTYAWLSEVEHAIWKLLDGRTSAAQVLERFAARFSPRQLSPLELQSFLVQLHRQGLVVSDAPGQGEQLAQRKNRKERFSPLRLAEQLVALRWRGVDPEPLLAWLDPALGWLFTRAGLVLWALVVAWAAALAIWNGSEIARRLPSAQAWLAGSNLVWLGVATILVKTLHELGHALAARRMGCRPREVGVQLFFLLPCLYTNVSDVWLVPGKWRRMAVSAAGIYVELLLAAIATILWWHAEPGVLASLSLNVMLVASVGTLLLNGNPLLRYDGYYLLSDLVEVPNLEQQSRQQLAALAGQWFAGLPATVTDEVGPAKRCWLAAYAAAAFVYRAALLVVVYFAVRALLAPYRLQPLCDVLVGIAAVGMVMPLAVASVRQLRQAQRRRELRPARMVLAGAVAAGLILAAALIPLPQRVTLPVVIEPEGASAMYVTVAGTLTSALPAGTRVHRGQTIAQLASPELARDRARLESEVRRQELHLAALEATRGDDPAARAAVPAAQQTLADLQHRLAQVRAFVGKLQLTAPHDGIILPPPRRRPHNDERQLATWLGTPLDLANRGSHLETGTLLCLIGHSGRAQALAIAPQSEASLVQADAHAILALPQWPHGTIRGRVDSVSQLDADLLPAHMAASGAIPQKLDAQGRPQPLEAAYQVRIALVDPPPLLPGATGRALVTAPPQSLAARLGRWLGTTFRFRTGGDEAWH
jgi:putative peptide zinc metalloprotease protein